MKTITINALNPEHTLVDLNHDLYILRQQKKDFVNNLPDLTNCTIEQVNDYKSFLEQERHIINEIELLFQRDIKKFKN